MADDIEDLMLNIAWKDFDICINDKRDLENKASIILATNAVLIGLVLDAISKMNSIIASFGSVFLFVSAIFCILAIKLRDYKYLETMKTWKEFENDEVIDFLPQAKRNLFATIDSATRFNRNNYKKIVFWINLAISFFLIGVFLIALALITNFNWVVF